MNWMPIETAPTGQDIIIYDKELLHPIVVGKGYDYGNDDGVCFYDCIDGYPYNPTHWMPLPEPPINQP